MVLYLRGTLCITGPNHNHDMITLRLVSGVLGVVQYEAYNV